MRRGYQESQKNKDRSIEVQPCIIGPGYIAVSSDPAMLCSVCGNGVVVTLWEHLRKIGGMIHCVYPTSEHRAPSSNYCADTALYQLLSQMVKANAHPLYMEAQIFGAGSLNGYAAKRAAKVVKTIRKILHKFDIDVVSEDIGGRLGRKVIFHTLSGETMVVKTKNVRKADWAPEFAVNECDT